MKANQYLIDFYHNQYDPHQLSLCFVQDKFSSCKAEEGGDGVASLTDDNEAGGNLDKRNIRLIGAVHIFKKQSYGKGIRDSM